MVVVVAACRGMVDDFDWFRMVGTGPAHPFPHGLAPAGDEIEAAGSEKIDEVGCFIHHQKIIEKV